MKKDCLQQIREMTQTDRDAFEARVKARLRESHGDRYAERFWIDHRGTPMMRHACGVGSVALDTPRCLNMVAAWAAIKAVNAEAGATFGSGEKCRHALRSYTIGTVERPSFAVVTHLAPFGDGEVGEFDARVKVKRLPSGSYDTTVEIVSTERAVQTRLVRTESIATSLNRVRRNALVEVLDDGELQPGAEYLLVRVAD